ncbi:MAG: TetR/AcrR family transcriptional regulator [Pontibacterium sp.]
MNIIGRPLGFDPDIALESAMQSFWRHGYEACSMQNLLEATGLSKSSIYKTFGGKHALFAKCLSLYQQRSATRMTSLLAQAPSGMSFLRQVFTAVNDDAKDGQPKGCFVMNTASELGQSDPEIARMVEESLALFKSVFRDAVERAQAEGSISISKNPDDLAIYLVTCMGGLRTMVKAGSNKESIEQTIEIMLGALA